MTQTVGELIRYGSASILTYAWMFCGTYFFTESIGFPANIAYGIVITVTYIANYFLNAYFVFTKSASSISATKFVIHSIVFWLLNNIFYSALFYFTAIHYLALVILNIVIFMPLRFMSIKWYVFKKEPSLPL